VILLAPAGFQDEGPLRLEAEWPAVDGPYARMRRGKAIASLANTALRVQSDARLVALSREGYEAAFEEIVRRYRPHLVSLAGAIAPASQAEDIVQEALTRAHASIVEGDQELVLRPWLYTVVRNRALNVRRDQRSHEQIDEDYDGVPQPPDVAARRARLAMLVGAIKDLPDKQRRALVARELEGRGHDEIAAQLGVSAGAVRQLIFRARVSVRDAVGSVIPIPALRALIEAGGAGGSAVAGGAAAAGLAGGTGGSLALKSGVAVVVAGLAIGGGAAVRDHADEGGPSSALAAAGGHGGPASSSKRAAGAGVARDDAGVHAGSSESRNSHDLDRGGDSGDGGSGHGGGPSGEDHGDDGGFEGSGGAEAGDDGSEGPGGGFEDGGTDGGSEGPGGGGDDFSEPPDVDSPLDQPEEHDQADEPDVG
jgi:RNA polymerase sigma factor (sigma-70 family)